MIVTWHSPAEMLPQVGQECWIVLYGEQRSAYSARLVRSGYGQVGAWRMLVPWGGPVDVTADKVEKWCRVEEIDAPWGDRINLD
jgi:hypothetical protein